MRATAFLEYVEENPHDAVAAREPDRRSLDRELQREQEQHFLSVQESKPKRSGPKLSAEARTVPMFDGSVMHQRGRRGALAAPPALKLSVQEPESPPAGPPVDTRSVQMFPPGGYKNPQPGLSDIPF